MYWNIEEISNNFRPEGEAYEKAVKEKEEAEKRLMEILPDGGVEVFGDFMNALGDVEIFQVEEIYRQGFSLGLQITAEAYITNKNKLVSSIDE